MTLDIKALIARWDGETVVTRFDRPTGTWIFIALHNTLPGMASGGTRMKTYDSPEDGLLDAMRLAEGMTSKWAAVDFDYGGGKAVLATPGPLAAAERIALLRRYGRVIESLRGAFGTGVDLGTTADDMLVLAEETRYVHGVDRAAGRSIDPGPFTARGVFSGLRTAVRHRFGSDDLAGRSVVVQGVGGVGGPLARLLREAGARLLLADLDRDRAAALAAELGGEVVEGDPRAVACDVYAPCAVGGILDERSIATLRCAIVAGSANNQLGERADAERLAARGILYAPDFIINAGGAIALALLGRGVARDTIQGRVTGIGDALAGFFAEAEKSGESPLRAAERRVETVLQRYAGKASAGLTTPA